MIRLALIALSLIVAPMAQAEPPRVAVDIAPVHGLVAQVMGDLGTPDLVITPGATPHDYTLRPSQAAALETADLVIWMGPELTPWLSRSLTNLAPDTQAIALLDNPQTMTLGARDAAVFATQDFDQGDDRVRDPHAWLDPENARIWLGLIADALAGLDPDNKDTYRANAAAAIADVGALRAEIMAQIAPVRDTPFIVFHDAYQYFETRFGLNPLGAISLTDAATPGAARIEDLRDIMTSQDVACVFSEPQFNAGLVDTVMDGRPARTTVIDPMGVDIPPGPSFYLTLLSNVAGAFTSCLSGG
jgi:zinc transport system substrate-binding protein